MKILLSLYLSIFSQLLCASFDPNSLPEIYQDILVNGKVLQKGTRACSDRYEAIKGVLDSIPFPFSVLDIGASQGYFSFRITNDYPAICTMIEDGYTTSQYMWNTGNLLLDLCNKNTELKNLIFLQKRVYADDLQEISKTDSFDVVLALSVAHHMRKEETSYEEFDNVIDSILSLGEIVLIENPTNTGEHTKYIRNYLLKKNGQIIYTSLRSNLLYELFLFRNPPKTHITGLSKKSFLKLNGKWPVKVLDNDNAIEYQK